MAEQKRQAFRLEVNAPITVRLDEMDRQFQPHLIDISESGCRIRAGVRLSQNARVSFNWLGPSREPISINGRIVAARMAGKTTAEYGIKFELAPAQRDRLAHELLEIQRRKAYKPTDGAGAREVATGELGGRAKRSAYRAAVQFPVAVNVYKDARWVQTSGEANDLSAGGLLLAVAHELPDETPLEIVFTLPLGVVNLGGDEREVVEVTPFGERRSKQLVPVRPFERIQTKAVVVKRIGSARNGWPQYGTRFVELPEFSREEIARFVHAFQLTQLRKAAATQG